MYHTVARCRPLLPGESGQIIWHLNEAQATVQQINDTIIRKYYFNTVALPDTSSSELYQRVLRPAVLKACRGYNTTFFGYGGVGTGKSFTFHGNRASPGFILLTVGDIFLYIANHQPRQFLLRFFLLRKR